MDGATCAGIRRKGADGHQRPHDLRHHDLRRLCSARRVFRDGLPAALARCHRGGSPATRPRQAADALGSCCHPVRALLLALLLTSPMIIGLAMKAPLTLTVETSLALVRHALLPGFGEELLYRVAGWGFPPAALIGALLFGGAHLSQGGSAVEAAGIFATTALGGVWFAWLYVEWDFDLWVPVAFHVLMNAWWMVFPVADNALGPLWAVGVRSLVIILSVAVTLAYAKRRGGRRIQWCNWRWCRGSPRANE